tara:strand:- start:580 stop:882 length:303 start_codon:yes stop_codon:yes gene_type:complete
MAYTKYAVNSEAAKLHRKEAGSQVRQWRLDQDLTQRDLAQKLGLDYYTFVSQVETGAARVPPEAIADWAKALNKDVRAFAKFLLRHYDPHTYAALFHEQK